MTRGAFSMIPQSIEIAARREYARAIAALRARPRWRSAGRKAASGAGRCSANSASKVSTRQTKMPLFQRYRRDATKRCARAREGCNRGSFPASGLASFAGGLQHLLVAMWLPLLSATLVPVE